MAYKSDTDHRDLPNKADLTVFNGELSYDYHLEQRSTRDSDELEELVSKTDVDYSIEQISHTVTALNIFFDEAEKHEVHEIAHEL